MFHLAIVYCSFTCLCLVLVRRDLFGLLHCCQFSQINTVGNILSNGICVDDRKTYIEVMGIIIFTQTLSLSLENESLSHKPRQNSATTPLYVVMDSVYVSSEIRMRRCKMKIRSQIGLHVGVFSAKIVCYPRVKYLFWER